MAEPPLVLILSCDIGAGHDVPARMIANDVLAERPGVDAVVADGLLAMGKMCTWVLRDQSDFMFRWWWMFWLFDFQYWLISAFPPTRWLARNLLFAFGARGLRRYIASLDPDAVVSTYPGVTEVLGRLRRRRKLKMPIYSAITDLAGLLYWAHPGVDVHLVTHRESIPEVERIAGPQDVRWVTGLYAPDMLVPRDRDQARAALALPLARKLVLVSGGGWGVGDLEGATRVALERPDVEVCCLCGHNAIIKQRMDRAFEAEPRVRVYGFTDHMSEFLAAADALIHSTAGLTVLEAQIRGCPVISYGWSVAHIRLNNEAYRRHGLADTVTSKAELAASLDRALSKRHAPDESFAQLPKAASIVLEAIPGPPDAERATAPLA